MTETDSMRRTMIAACSHAMRLLRNQVGRYRILRDDGSTQWLTTGLVPGSGDLIGWRTIVVTPEMVGRRLAVFTSVEMKKPKSGKHEPDQISWAEAVNNAGGIAVFATSEHEAISKVLSRSNGV
jgi:hypothetical protein